MSAFWAAMQANDWDGAAGHLAPTCVIDWPCSGERIVGRADYAAVKARYPTSTGSWTFDVHRMVVGADTVVSEVTVSDGQQSARPVVLSEFDGEEVGGYQVEYWPAAYDPMPGREDLVRRIDRVP